MYRIWKFCRLVEDFASIASPETSSIQAYKNQLRDSNIISQDTSHSIFLNLDGLVDFQRRFLIGVEAHAVQPPESQRFGHLFISMVSACQWLPLDLAHNK